LTVPSDTTRAHIASWVLMACALLFVLLAHLLPALLAGLLVHELLRVVSDRISLKKLKGRRAKIAVVALLATIVVSLLIAGIMGTLAFFHSGGGRLPALLSRLAEILESSKAMLPAFVQEYMPANTEALQQSMVTWLREHATEVQGVGKDAGVVIAHVLIGMILGALISLHEVATEVAMRPLAAALSERVERFSLSFRRVVFAQVRIAFINASFTWLYLAVALPFMDIHLPLTKTMIALTFILGLIPVVGNLISNTIIVIVSLSVSLQMALTSLAFLVVIHKLEYFLNARIVGSQINARAWEILTAMLMMEAVFGLAGVVAAPIYYAYLKNELLAKKLI
jgi:predicted PurR-regulated permease PerM